MEIRFRDALACIRNEEYLKAFIRRGFNRIETKTIDLTKFRILAREFPLIRDKVGYQLRFIDILATNTNRDLIIIELKVSYTKRRSISKIEEQIHEYEDLIKENIRDIKNKEDFLSVFHYYQKEIFNFMHFDHRKYGDIHKIIIFMRQTAPFDTSKLNKVPIAITKENEIEALKKNYVNFQIERINGINPGYKEVLINNCFEGQSEEPKYRPLPLTWNEGEENPYFRFEYLSSSSIKEKYVSPKRVNNKEELPKLFFQDNEKITHREIFDKLNEGRFTIQLFNSGRSFPVFYFEYEHDKFLPFQQIKPRLFERGILVNKVVAEDASGLSGAKRKKTLYDEVMCFDVGLYKTEPLDEFGVMFKKFHLKGIRYDIQFEFIGPKIRNDLSNPPLLPYMDPQKKREQIEQYQQNGINPFTNEWISTNLRIKPI